MHLLLASTSTVHGRPYLSYLANDIRRFFTDCSRIVFIPYARPGGLSHDAYTAKAAEVFEPLGFELRGLHSWAVPSEGLTWADGFFTGGGNTFVLLQTLQELGLMAALRGQVRSGKSYMGTSAGSNLAGKSISTTNDMPIVFPQSFEALGLIPFNLNPHYLDPIPGSTHMGETRETRIKEFHVYNQTPVAGLREGSSLEIHGEEIRLLGEHSVRVFQAGLPAEEIQDANQLKVKLGMGES